jgi:large repetitive protein
VSAFSFRRLLLNLGIAVMLLLSFQVPASAASLSIRLGDRVTGAFLGGVELSAYEKLADGSRVWRAARTTDAEGLARFDLDGLGSGRTFVVRSNPYGHWVDSDEFTSPGGYGFWVGKLQVQVIDGTSRQPLSKLPLTLKRWSADGNYTTVLTTTTDAAGWVRLDPPALGENAYVLVGQSPTDGQQKVSTPYWVKGPHVFALGNAPVVVSVRDGVSNVAMANQWVEVWEQLASGAKVLRHKRWTDAQGMVKFDLDDVAAGQRYELKAQPYLQPVETGPLTAAGEHVLKAGKLQVQVIDGRNDQPYAWRDVTLLEVLADGTYKPTGVFRTDGEGKLRLDPPALGTTHYALRAPSLVDGRWKTSATYATGGVQVFKVGGAALSVRLADRITEAYLAGVELTAYEKLPDGSTAWRAARVTDAEGLARFDLDGLGSGRTFVIRAKPYGHWVDSDEIKAVGGYGFWVGKLQVQVVDGVSGKPLSGQPLTLKRWDAGGNHIAVLTTTTDGNGWVRLDPPALGENAYVLVGTSPTDGQQKLSTPYWVKGPHVFKLGNAPVVVKVVDGITSSTMPGQWVEAWELLANGQKILRNKRWTADDGTVKFDLDGVTDGRRYQFRAQPYQQAVESAVVTGAGSQVLRAGALQVRVLDGRTNQPYAMRDVTLSEVLGEDSYGDRGTFRTNTEGMLRLDPDALGQKSYALRAASPVDGSIKTSETYTGSGSHVFKVGGGALSIRLGDRVTGAFLGGVELSAYEKLADGSRVWRAARTTDAEGLARFDLDGLGSGRTFVVRSNPYGHWVDSDEFTSPGGYGFWVGKLQVQVIDGTSRQPLSKLPLTLKRWSADGNYTTVLTTTTDAAGWVRLDPPALGENAYVLVGQSPTDGQQKVSTPYWVKGPHVFALGNAPVVVSVRDGVSNVAMANQWVEVWEQLASGAKVLRHKRWTDAQGMVKFDLDDVAAGQRYELKAQPYLQPVETGPLTAAGEHVLKAGKLQVQVIDGRNDQPYAWRDVTLLEVLADGTYKPTGVFRTDGEGKLRLDPPALGTTHYALRAPSLVDGTQKTSSHYATGGSQQFRIGGAGLLVRVIDHVSETGLAGLDVDAYERSADGTDTWRTKRTTDADGRASFDLDGLGDGRRYVLKAQPYGRQVNSDVLSDAGWYGFRVGTSPVTLTDATSGAAIPATTVVAYEKRPDGSLRLAAQGITSTQGLIRFDLDGLGNGAEYVLLAQHPFDDGNDYYSAILTWRGPYAFSLQRDKAEKLDLELPTVEILEPGTASRISVSGIRLSGTAEDNKWLKEVRVVITLPSGAVVEKTASYRVATHTWFVHTGAFAAEETGAVHVMVTAVDSSFNEAHASLDLNLIRDTTPPALKVESHASGSQVPMGGFVVSGSISDDTLGQKLTASVSGGGLLSAVTRDVEVAQASGRWAMVVAPDDAFSATPLTLSLIARDGAGNEATTSLSLQPSERFAQAWHALQRTSFGADPQAYAAASQMGAAAFIQQQLDPESLDDGAYEQRAANWPSDGTHIATRALRRSTYSHRQLREVMTWFWNNHFNTYYNAHHNSEFENREMEGFRANALGSFRALLGVSAHSPAMLYTLDGIRNMKGRPNENYGRELLELHSLGVDGGYTQQDVEEVARAFTGWTVESGVFAFNAALHDSAAKVILGQAIAAGGGQSDGETVLNIVAGHSSTARFICRKLVALFVSDQPVDSLVGRCAATFLSRHAASDQMGQVVSTILASPEFQGAGYRGAKIKTPLEFVLGAVRQFGGENVGDDLGLELQRQSMPLFLNPSPTGYPEGGAAWLSSNMLLSRIRFADRLLAYAPGDAQTQISLAERMTAQGFMTAEGVAGRMLEWTLGPNFTNRERQLALDVLTEVDTYPYMPALPDTELRLRRLGKALMSLPGYQYQ